MTAADFDRKPTVRHIDPKVDEALAHLETIREKVLSGEIESVVAVCVADNGDSIITSKLGSWQCKPYLLLGAIEALKIEIAGKCVEGVCPASFIE